jgi:hypothetical protein
MPLADLRPASWEWLLFFHLVFALLLFGGFLTVLLASALARSRGDPAESALLGKVARRALLLVVWPALVGTIALGEALAGTEDARGGWLDASRGLTYAGGLLGAGLLTWLTGKRPRGVPGALSGALLAVLLAVVFLMTTKPGG